jgi:Flp pilus assembly pilin Flp
MNTRGQALVEYALIIGVVAAAVAAMATYMKRGVQSNVKVAADAMSPLRALNSKADPTGEETQLMGIRYESGDRRPTNTTSLIGYVAQRESAVTTQTNQVSSSVFGTSTKVSTTGSLTSRGPGVSSYSEVVVNDR